MHKDLTSKTVIDLLTFLKENYFEDNFGGGRGYEDDDGDGYGFGFGHDSGDNGSGWGDGFCWGNSDGFGDGFDNGYGDGWVNDNGDNGQGIVEINGMKVYVIDDLLTAIETVLGTYAKGYNIREDFTFVPCYVAMDGVSLAHGKTLKEAFRDARAKELEVLPENERVNRFVTEHPNPEENLLNEELFTLHHALTGSCEFGRREFCQKNSIDLESSMSISKFIALTENEYGGNVIKKIREEYSRRG